ncbi:origin recognition complex subunit 2 [Monomorium pharaonis]|uniref:origin recognition complex subunit 2 n=1 Tax=Monomorium pharaonis TaxID=307658 RepID=UPI001746CBA2|nr:origin recognition complex subunit 2 [Monomorium pharaonis]
MASSKNLRRSARVKTLVKYTEDSDEGTPQGTPQSNILKVELEKQLEDVEEDVQKPLELFSNKDVSGRKLYGFQTPTKRNNMMIKANQCRTPETPKSFKTLPVLKIVLDKIMMRDFQENQVLNNDDIETRVSRKRYLPSVNSSGDESVSEDSEYVPTDNEVSSESDGTSDKSENSENSDMSEENNVRRGIKQRVLKPLPKRDVQSTPKRPGRGRKTVAYKDYHIKTDEYFESQSEKIITSDHTLGRLRNARLTKDTLGELLTNQSHISTIHKKRICSLTENCKSFFPMWQFILEEGYSLLLYGIGSKRNLINDFHNEIITNHPTLIINGFFPSLTLKDILDNITSLLDVDSPSNPNDCLELIETIMRNNPDDRLYLIVHNIDGIMLRSNKAQNMLASLATVPNIHVIASADHINASLLWDHIKRAKFNFYWWDATTLLPYKAETSYESSLLVQQSSGLVLSSLQNVFLSLTSNARTIYLILVKYQLSNSNSNFAGMPFKDLYRSAREQFLVSSDLALRAQLTEFIDHKLLRTKRTVDGAEHLIIPLDKTLLKQFLEQHGS